MGLELLSDGLVVLGVDNYGGATIGKAVVARYMEW